MDNIHALEILVFLSEMRNKLFLNFITQLLGIYID